MKKMLFICPCATQETLSKVKYGTKYYILPLGVLSIVAYCQKTAGEEAELAILDFNTTDYEKITLAEMLSKIETKVREFQPDIVGVSVLFDSLLDTLDGITTLVKNINNNIFTICGGTATSISYDDILIKHPNIDAVCYSEGEVPFSELLKANSIGDELKANNAFVTREKLLINGFKPESKFLYNLDEIPRLPYHMLNMGGYTNTYNSADGKKSVVMHTVRGCPFNCKFCTAPKMFGQKLRILSAERVLSDLQHLVKTYGFKKLSIFDEQLLAQKHRAKKILNGISEMGLRLELDNGVNIALLDDEIIEIFLKCDIQKFVLSIESGSQFVLSELMNKPVDLEVVQKVLPKLMRGSFYVVSNFVLGMPGETDTHREETKNFILNAAIDWSAFFVALPFKGSRLYDECKENGSLEYDEEGSLRVKTSEIEYHDLEMKAYLINLECNFVKNHSMRVGNYDRAKMLIGRVKNKYDFHAFAHYYYAQCCLKLGEEQEYKDEMDYYFQLVANDDEWRGYAKRFGLPLEKAQAVN